MSYGGREIRQLIKGAGELGKEMDISLGGKAIHKGKLKSISLG